MEMIQTVVLWQPTQESTGPGNLDIGDDQVDLAAPAAVDAIPSGASAGPRRFRDDRALSLRHGTAEDPGLRKL
jgi:hypothetical protein